MTSTQSEHSAKPLRVAMIGYAFMGATHSLAWRTAPRAFDLPLDPQLTVVCGRNASAAAEAARRLGWSESATDWRGGGGRRRNRPVGNLPPGGTPPPSPPP